MGEVFTGGTEALVLAVDWAEGTPAVLKLLVTRVDHVDLHEVTALHRADGRGRARLL